MGSDQPTNTERTTEENTMSPAEKLDPEANRITLQLFVDRLIDREEAEERTGLYLSEILILMGRLGIKRKPVGPYEGMYEAQKDLFEKVFGDDPVR
jgi:hypothetical protein